MPDIFAYNGLETKDEKQHTAKDAGSFREMWRELQSLHVRKTAPLFPCEQKHRVQQTHAHNTAQRGATRWRVPKTNREYLPLFRPSLAELYCNNHHTTWDNSTATSFTNGRTTGRKPMSRNLHREGEEQGGGVEQTRADLCWKAWAQCADVRMQKKCMQAARCS